MAFTNCHFLLQPLVSKPRFKQFPQQSHSLIFENVKTVSEMVVDQNRQKGVLKEDIHCSYTP